MRIDKLQFIDAMHKHFYILYKRSYIDFPDFL